MAFTQKHNFSVSVQGGDSTSFNYTYQSTGGEQHNISEVIPDSSTDLEVVFVADVTAMKMFAMWCDQDALIETNDGTTPTDSISLIANEPLVWSTSTPYANPFSADITTNLFVTTGAVGSATLNIRMIQDATP